MKLKLATGLIILTLAAGILSACAAEPVDIPPSPLPVTEAESREIAQEFLGNSPTFQFDGIEGSIVLTETLETFGFYTWGFVFGFVCANAGYGDRAGMAVATVITPHTAIVAVSQGTVDGGTIDVVWNMLAQQELATPPITSATAP